MKETCRGFLKTKVSFFREYPCQLKIGPQLHPLFFAYGVSAKVDPLSGMTVNLVLVDEWAKHVLAAASTQSWKTKTDFFLFAHRELQKKAEALQASVARLEILDEKQTRWLFDPSIKQLQWQKRFPVVVGDQAQWLKVQASVSDENAAQSFLVDLEKQICSRTWKDAKVLQQFFSTMQIAILKLSLQNHFDGSEIFLCEI